MNRYWAALLIAALSAVTKAQTFSKVFGDIATNEGGNAIASGLDGSLFVGGYRSDSALIMKLDPLGSIQWSRTFKTGSIFPDIVRSMTVTDDNYLIGCGNSMGGSPDIPRAIFYFKFALNGDVQWIQESDDTRPVLAHALLPRSFSEYVLVGEIYDMTSVSFPDPISHGVAAGDGSLIWTSPRYDYIPNNSYIDDVYAAVIGNGASYYTTGRTYLSGSSQGSMRPFISKFNAIGDHLWTRYYITNSTNEARAYGIDILYEQDSLTVCYFGDINQYSSDFRVGLVHTDSTGIVAWARDYDISAFGSEISYKVVRMPYGYAITGYGSGSSKDLFVIALSAQGHVLWAKGFGTVDDEDLRYTVSKNAVAAGDHIVFTGRRTTGGNDDILLYRISSTGSISCGGSYDLSIVETDGPTFSEPIDPQEIPDEITYGPAPAGTWSPMNNDCSFADVFLGNDTIACSSLQLDASSTGATTYLWQDGSMDATFTANGPGIYWVFASTDCCFSSDTIVITGDAPPEASFYAQTDPCHLEVEFQNTSNNADEYEWLLGDGSFSYQEEPTNMYDSAGTYTVELIASNGCGADTASQIIGIGAPGILSLQGPATICDGEEVSYSVALAGGGTAQVLWSTGDTTSTIVLSISGDQLLSATVIGEDGCVYEAELAVHVIGLDGEAATYVPNVFSPNGDGLNELFGPVLSDPEGFRELLIFNRWGEEIYATSSIMQPWNGRFEGEPVPDGTYVYIVRWKDRCTGVKKEEHGHVTLLR